MSEWCRMKGVRDEENGIRFTSQKKRCQTGSAKNGVRFIYYPCAVLVDDGQVEYLRIVLVLASTIARSRRAQKRVVAASSREFRSARLRPELRPAAAGMRRPVVLPCGPGRIMRLVASVVIAAVARDGPRQQHGSRDRVLISAPRMSEARVFSRRKVR